MQRLSFRLALLVLVILLLLSLLPWVGNEAWRGHDAAVIAASALAALALSGLIGWVMGQQRGHRSDHHTAPPIAEEPPPLDTDAWLQAVLDHLHDGLVIAIDGRLLHWNRAALSLYGFTEADRPPSLKSLRTMFTLSLPDGTPLSDRDWPMSRLARGEAVEHLDLVVTRREGGWQRILRYHGARVHDPAGRLMMLLTLADVTQSLQALATLERSHERLRATGQLAQVGGWEIDLPSRGFELSAEARRILGFTPEQEVLHGSVLACFAADVGAGLQAHLRAAIVGGEPWDVEAPLLAPDGARRWVRISGRAVRERGRTLRVIGAMQDVTERKQAELALAEQQQHLEALVLERTTELARARDAAEAANRAKSNFLANMSHEIRTPMNAIIGLTHLLRADVVEPRSRAWLGKVDSAAQHLLGVINDILDLSKIESGRATLDVREFALADVVAHSLDMVRQPALDKGIALAVELDPALPARLSGDAMRLEQVLVNFLVNAVKFSDHGTVTLRLGQRPHATYGAGWLCLRVEVQDEGVGLSAEQRERLFMPFSQVDESTTRRHGGTGLGLAIVKRVATMMGGDVGVASRVGAGSTFWMTALLQAASDDGAAPSPTVAAAGGGSESAAAAQAKRAGAVTAAEAATAEDPAHALRERFAGAHVLLADDDPVNQMVVEALLVRLGLQVDVVSGGEQAIHRVHDTDYALVLMDMQMPVVDGLSATRAIRTLPGRQRLPIVALTANAFAEDRERCIAAGMNDHLSKPIEPRKFEACLLKWLTAGAAMAA